LGASHIGAVGSPCVLLVAKPKMKVRKTLIQLLVLSFALALYQVMFQPMYDSYLQSMGRSIGIAEVALGYFITGALTFVVTKMLTRRMT
jgi:hypothetical protein